METLREFRIDELTVQFIHHFLQPRTFDIWWDGQKRGRACMDQGTPQGTPLSPVIWLIYISRTLKKAEARIEEINPRTRQHRWPTRIGTRQHPQHPPKLQVHLFSSHTPMT